MNNKILITGAFGFIGSHLTEMLITKGYDVIAYDRYNIDNNYGWLNNSKFKNDIEFCLGDIRDYDSVYKAINKSTNVIHLAALIGIPYSYISPLAYVRTNIEGTYNILEASKNKNIENILITSTSEVYGSALITPINEEHRIIGQSPYSASKIAADQLALSYYNSFDLPVKLIRPFNVYGPRQSTRAIIPTIITQALNSKKKLNLGNTDTKRDYTYVTDTCEGFLEIFHSNKSFGEITNIGTNKSFSILDIANKIFNIIGVQPEIIKDINRVRPTKSEVTELHCDNSKLIKNTNWTQKISFDDGLKETIKWFEKYKDNYNSLNYHV